MSVYITRETGLFHIELVNLISSKCSLNCDYILQVAFGDNTDNAALAEGDKRVRLEISFSLYIDAMWQITFHQQYFFNGQNTWVIISIKN